MFGSEFSFKLDLDPSLANDLSNDYDLRERLEDWIKSDVPIDIDFSVKVVDQGRQLEVTVDFDSLASSIDFSIDTFNPDEDEMGDEDE